jgi:predicted ATPase
MILDRQLDTLETSGLISLAATLPDLEYLFCHALIQDAASASLLKSDRRKLHRLVGEAPEPSFEQPPADLAPVLALHFAEASDTKRALRYYTVAGEAAASRYANAEAANF